MAVFFSCSKLYLSLNCGSIPFSVHCFGGVMYLMNCVYSLMESNVHLMHQRLSPGCSKYLVHRMSFIFAKSTFCKVVSKIKDNTSKPGVWHLCTIKIKLNTYIMKLIPCTKHISPMCWVHARQSFRSHCVNCQVLI